MEQQFDVILTGSDGPVEGIAEKLAGNGYAEAYKFVSVDETIHLTIAKEKGQWTRIAGSDPYLGGWTEELAEQILAQKTV